MADAKAFATEFTVYTYDRRGRGDSEDTHPYRVERESYVALDREVEALLDVGADGRAVKQFLRGIGMPSVFFTCSRSFPVGGPCALSLPRSDTTSP
ncbi:alpha/beta fold hydrolase [Nocardia testacea]|uniref:alpha/beta fold hydrolase n=1 Tax=Nocardia testacea TaxID=248551 RepID=UPI0033D1D2C4